MISFSEAGFLLNASFTLSIGYYGIFGSTTLPTRLEQYPNLLLTQSYPVETLVLWCIIYLSQFIYILIQSYHPYQSSLVTTSGVGYCYFWSSVFQMGWIVSTSFDFIWAAVICLALSVLFSTTIVLRQGWYLRKLKRELRQWQWEQQRKRDKKLAPSFFDNHETDDDDDDDDTTVLDDAPPNYDKSETSAMIFWVVQFPFASYCGLLWTFLATFVQIVLVRYYPDDISEAAEYYVVLGFIVFLGVFGLILLLLFQSVTTSWIMPLIWSWYLIRVYLELQSPMDAIIQRFSQDTVTLVQYESLGVGIALLFFSIFFCALCRCCSSGTTTTTGVVTDDNDDDDDDTAKSSNGSSTSYVRQEDIESKGGLGDSTNHDDDDSSSDSLSRPYKMNVFVSKK